MRYCLYYCRIRWTTVPAGFTVKLSPGSPLRAIPQIAHTPVYQIYVCQLVLETGSTNVLVLYAVQYEIISNGATRELKSEDKGRRSERHR